MSVKYPDIKVQLTGQDGNAYAILFAVGKALRKNNVSTEDIAEFKQEAMFGDYDNLLQTCCKWVSVS